MFVSKFVVKHMKKYLLKLVFIFLLPFSLAADEVPALKFTVAFSKSKVKVGDEVELIFKAQIPTQYHIYGIYKKCKIEDDGPNMTEVVDFVLSGGTQIGVLSAVGEKIEHDDIFGCDEGVLHGVAEFRQKVKISSTKFSLAGTLKYQVCSENSCGAHDFVFALSDKNIKIKK